MRKEFVVLIAILVIAAGMGTLAVFRTPPTFLSSVAAQGQTPAAPSQSPGAGVPAAGLLAGMESTLEGIYDQVSPSVVAVHVMQKRVVEVLGFPPFSSPAPRGPQRQYQYRQALGSGFVWDREGHIITNYHVIAGADRITITLSDGTTVAAKAVGTDSNSDLAVLKVEALSAQLRPVRLGDSTRLKVGQLAIAIGNPFGQQNTMTTGIISALGRSLPVSDGETAGPVYTIPDVIQTDAPVNPGNSGGVLLDDQGRLIGVTSAIESPAGVSAGIGFAIPSVIVQKVVSALIQSGHYAHPWLGVSGVSLTPDLAKAMGLRPDQHGALVIDVTPGSPADQARLRGSDRQTTIDGEKVRVGGDVIVALDGQPVRGFDDLVAYLARQMTVGQTVSVTVLRQGREQMFPVRLAARPSQQSQ